MAKKNENKTLPTKKSVDNFLKQIKDPGKQEDAFAVLELMKKVTKEEPVMWGDSLVGFGTYHYKYASGREGDYFLTGFSPRVQNLTIYFLSGFKILEDLMQDLGKYKNSNSCLYIKNLEDINLSVLKKMIKISIANTAKVNS